MPEISSLASFILASLVVLILPGPGVVYVVARSAAQGSAAGLVSAAGLSAGAFLQVLAATAGLSAVLVTSATAFAVVKWIGAGYLIYLGVSAILSRTQVKTSNTLSTATPALPWRRLFFDGVVVSFFNPKIALFFLAYLPQFVSAGGASATQQIFVLGCLYAVLAFMTDGSYALIAGRIRLWAAGRLGGWLGARTWPRFMIGGLYIGLGVKAALSERPS
ncbi:MAG: LysE family translocator [Pseudomonadota bacterium]